MYILPSPILAVETSAGATSVALWNGKKIDALVEQQPNQQAEKLVPMMQALLKKQNISCEQLAGYATTLGPGSFTGIRIGLSALVGMQTVFPRPLYGLNTLEVAAFQAGLKDGGMIVREALRGQAYVQHFGKNFEAESEVLLLDYADIPTTKTVFSNCSSIEGSSLPAVSAEGILGLLLARETAPLPKSEQKPLYIRAPDAKLPKVKAISQSTSCEMARRDRAARPMARNAITPSVIANEDKQ